MIIEEYDENLFISRFEDYKRVTTRENTGNFTYRGLRALYNYLNEVYDEENPFKMDVIALCCDFAEYKDLDEYLNDYSNEHSDFLEDKQNEFKQLLNDDEDFKKQYGEDEFIEWLEEQNEDEVIAEIEQQTTFIKLGDNLGEGFIIQVY